MQNNVCDPSAGRKSSSVGHRADELLIKQRKLRRRYGRTLSIKHHASHSISDL